MSSSETLNVQQYASNQSALLTHVIKNFGLFGFELVDNSVAACLVSHQLFEERETGGAENYRAEVNVNLTQTHQCPPGTILVEIIDNGCGIADLDSIVQFFSSSSSTVTANKKDASFFTISGQQICSSRNRRNKGMEKSKSDTRKVKVKGQYGVGLTTCLLFSQLNTHQQLRIATKTLEHTFCSCLDILFDTHSPFGQHRVQQQVLLEHSNFASGTRVSLYMPLPPGSHALSYVIDMLDVYFDRLSVMPSSSVATTASSKNRNATLVINFRVSAFQQSYQGVYTNISNLKEAIRTNEESETNRDPNNAYYSAFLSEQFTSRHARSLFFNNLPTFAPSRTTYKEVVFLASNDSFAPTYRSCETTRSIKNETKRNSKTQAGKSKHKNKKSKIKYKNKNIAGSEDKSNDNDGKAEDGDSSDDTTMADKVAHKNEEVEVKVSAILLFTTSTTTAANDTDSTEGKEKIGVQENDDLQLDGVQGLGDSIPLELWRYANYSPLLDEDDDALSCACSRALRAVSWPKLFGYSLKMDLQQQQPKNRQQGERGRRESKSGRGGMGIEELPSSLLAMELEVDDSNEEEEETSHEAAPHHQHDAVSFSSSMACSFPPSTLSRWVLIPVLSEEMLELREEERLSGRRRQEDNQYWEGHSDVHSEGCLEKIILVVNIIGASVPYSNMKKTAVEQKPALVKIITADMVSALQKVHRRLSEAPCGTELGELPVSLSFARDMFVSKADRLSQLMTGRYLPAIAAALAKMIQTSPSSEFHQECLQRLGLPAEFMDEALMSAHLLQCITTLANSDRKKL